MKLKVVTLAKSATIHLNGALTIGGPVENLRTAVSALVAGGFKDIRINMTRVPYADASGLGALVACRFEAQSAGASLAVEGARGKTRELLDLTRLEGLSRGEAPRTQPAGRAISRTRTAFSLSMLAPRVA